MKSKIWQFPLHEIAINSSQVYKYMGPDKSEQFYSEIPLPFPNSSYLLEPSNPMGNAEMRFLRL